MEGDRNMCEMLIEKAMIIDDVDCVKNTLEAFTGKKIQDIEIVRKFICTEQHTKFFIDKKMKSSINNDADHIYVWLDTGFTDQNKQAIFISLLNTGNEYVGHHVGTARTLAENIKGFFPKYKKNISENYSRFINKYNQKCAERENPHIEDENKYLLCKVNGNLGEDNELGIIIRQMNVAWEADAEVEKEECIIEESDTEASLSAQEQEITIGLLLDKIKEREKYIQEREQYIQELLNDFEKNRIESDVKCKNLVEIIKKKSAVIQEQSDALTRIRLFNEEETAIQFKRSMLNVEKQKQKIGHNLLENRKKIIVLGSTNLSDEVMKGIVTKEYGFEEDDFEYHLDYDKVVHSSGRIVNSSRYQAIIFGCCPHSVSGKGKWSSLIENCKQNRERTIVVDARNVSGNLKVTKASFRKALKDICMEISNVA